MSDARMAAVRAQLDALVRRWEEEVAATRASNRPRREYADALDRCAQALKMIVAGMPGDA